MKLFLLATLCLASTAFGDKNATTAKPTTAPTTTLKPTTIAPTTPTTAKPTTAKPTTAKPTTAKPTTAKPTTAKPTTAKPTTAKPTTAKPTTAKPTTAKPTTKAPTTTAKPTTKAPTTTAKPTTKAPTTTAKPTTKAPTTTAKPTTKAPTTTAKPTTKAPTTTAKPTTKAPTTTAKPTTKAPTTTAKPTTKAPTTTAKPTTKAPTTTAKPTTTVSPTPKNGTTAAPTTKPPTPSPYNLHFDVLDKGGKPCLSIAGFINIVVKESGKSDNVTQLTEAGGKASGTCSSMKFANETAVLSLTWPGVSLKVNFTGGDVWYMSGVKVGIGSKLSGSASFGPDALSKYFQAQHNHSYSCTEDRNVTISTKDKIDVVVDFVKVKIQPFTSDKPFDNSEACPSSVNPNPDSSIVPIAVGCALAGLIVIVLIAYLIGRRKGSGRGYQKV